MDMKVLKPMKEELRVEATNISLRRLFMIGDTEMANGSDEED